MERLLEKNIWIIMRTVVKFLNFRRRIVDLLGRRRADGGAHDETEDITGGSAHPQNEPRNSPNYGTDKQTYFDTSSTIASTFIPPPLAVVLGRSHLDRDCGPNGNAPEKSTLIISPDSARLEEQCTTSENSYASRVSEAKSLQTIDECYGNGQAPSVRQLRLHIHRIEMEFTARKDTQISVEAGDEVILTRVFDDGWVSFQWNSDIHSP